MADEGLKVRNYNRKDLGVDRLNLWLQIRKQKTKAIKWHVWSDAENECLSLDLES